MRLSPLIFALVLALATEGARAEETAPLPPEKVEKVQRLMETSMPDDQISAMAISTARTVIRQIDQLLAPKGKALSEAQKNEIMARFTVSFLANWEKVAPKVILIYARHYTDREIDLMLSLYENPEIAAAMAKMPAIMEEMTPLMIQLGQVVSQDVMQGLQRDGVLNDL